MARTKISEFSATAADNTDIDNIDIAEGCAPSGINNAIRELMAQLKDMQTGASGDTFTLTTVNSTTVDTTNLEVSNLKAKDGTAAGSIADSTGVVTLTSLTGTTADYTNLEVTNIKAKDGTAAASIADSTGVFTHATNTVFPAGAVGTPSITTAGDTNTGIFFPAADTIAFSEGGAEAMRIDSSGNVGIGTTNAAPANGKGMSINGGSITRIDLRTTTSGDASGDGTSLQLNGNNFTIENRESGYVAFATSLTERARIDSSGNLLVGTTVTNSSNSNSFTFQPVNKYAVFNHANGTASGTAYAFFSYNGGAIGSIAQNGTTGVLYNLTSDYRLKNDPQPLTGSKDFIMALQPKKWQWWDGSGEGVGFIAHEFMEVAKYSGNGVKDAVDAEGKPVYQSIQPSSSEVMANLIALVQEQQALITQLQADVAALQGAA